MTQQKNILQKIGPTTGLFLIILIFCISVGFKSSRLSFFERTNDAITVTLRARFDFADTVRMLFHRGTYYSKDNTLSNVVAASPDLQDVVFQIPPGDGDVKAARFDFGVRRGSIAVETITFSNSRNSIVWGPAVIASHFVPNQFIEKIVRGKQLLYIFCNEGGASLEYSGDLYETMHRMRRFSTSFILVGAFFIALLFSWVGRRRINTAVLRVSLVLLILFETLYLTLQSVSYTPFSMLLVPTDTAQLHMEVKVQYASDFQVFYTDAEGEGFSGAKSDIQVVDVADNFQWVHFRLGPGDLPYRLRIDPGTHPKNKIEIRSLKLISGREKLFWDARELVHRFRIAQHISHFVPDGESATIYTYDKDPALELIVPLPPPPENQSAFPLLISLLICGLTAASLFTREPKLEYARPTALTVLFVFIIFLPMLGYFASVQENNSNENRRLAERPEFSFNEVLKYPRRFTSYFEDQFFFRTLLVRANSYWKVNLLHLSPLPEKVLVGREPWLYLSGDHAIDDYAGIDSLNQESLMKIRANLKNRVEWFSKRGIKYYLALFPEKTWIYPEHLPSSVVRVHQTSKYDQLVQYLRNDPEIVLIDVRKALLEAKKEDTVYFFSDTHWNERGAFEAYKTIIRRVGQDLPNVNAEGYLNYTLTNAETTEGDLSRIISISTADPYPHYTPNFSNPAVRVPYSYPFPGIEAIAMHRADTTMPRLVMYRDSFTIALLPFMSQNFSRSLYLWTPGIDYGILENEKPDVVIQGIVERYVHLLE